jgi:hypothetical protein
MVRVQPDTTNPTSARANGEFPVQKTELRINDSSFIFGIEVHAAPVDPKIVRGSMRDEDKLPRVYRFSFAFPLDIVSEVLDLTETQRRTSCATAIAASHCPLLVADWVCLQQWARRQRDHLACTLVSGCRSRVGFVLTRVRHSRLRPMLKSRAERAPQVPGGVPAIQRTGGLCLYFRMHGAFFRALQVHDDAHAASRDMGHHDREVRRYAP